MDASDRSKIQRDKTVYNNIYPIFDLARGKTPQQIATQGLTVYSFKDHELRQEYVTGRSYVSTCGTS